MNQGIAMHSIPDHIIDKIVDYLPPSLNICLVNKRFKRERKPVTFVNHYIYQDHNWILEEMLKGGTDGMNAFELIAWDSLCQSRYSMFEECCKKVEQDMQHVFDRLSMYKDAINNNHLTHERFQTIFNVDNCIRSGNIALLLCGMHIKYPMVYAFSMIPSLINNCILFPTYMLGSPSYRSQYNYSDYILFIRKANADLIKWFVSKTLSNSYHDQKYLMSILVQKDDLEIFKYYYTKGYYLNENMIYNASPTIKRFLENSNPNLFIFET